MRPFARLLTFKSLAVLSVVALALLATPAAHALTGVLELRSSGLALDADRPNVDQNGCRVQLRTGAPGATNQQWVLIPVGDGWYRIENRASGLVLDADRPCADQNGCRVQLWQALPGATNQQWCLLPQ
jgi:alpha-L-fucosidase